MWYTTRFYLLNKRARQWARFESGESRRVVKHFSSLPPSTGPKKQQPKREIYSIEVFRVRWIDYGSHATDWAVQWAQLKDINKWAFLSSMLKHTHEPTHTSATDDGWTAPKRERAREKEKKSWIEVSIPKERISAFVLGDYIANSCEYCTEAQEHIYRRTTIYPSTIRIYMLCVGIK